jgi:hypothetical protein
MPSPRSASTIRLQGRIEALNNNWETLVRRGRGYRDLLSLMRLLRFMVVHPTAPCSAYFDSRDTRASVVR